MKCSHCEFEIKHDVFWNDDAPAQPFCGACYEELYCECGNRSWDGSGLCLDCLSAAQDRIYEEVKDMDYPRALEDMHEDAMHEGRV